MHWQEVCPQKGVLPAQDFRGQMISGEKVAQSCCCLCELPLASLSSSSFFFLQMYQLIMLSGILGCGGHGSLLGCAMLQCLGKDSQRCLVVAGLVVVKGSWGTLSPDTA